MYKRARKRKESENSEKEIEFRHGAQESPTLRRKTEEELRRGRERGKVRSKHKNTQKEGRTESMM